MTYSPTHGDYPSYSAARYAYTQHQHQHQSSSQLQPQPQHPSQHPHHHPGTHYPKSSYPHLHPSQIPVKVEDSPDLPPVSSLASYDSHSVKSSASSASLPVFRFGADFSSSASPTTPPFTFMSHQPWPSSSAASSSYAQQQSQHGHYPLDRYPIPSPVSPVNGHSHQALSLADEYDDEGGDELGDLPSGGIAGISLSPYGSGGGSKSEKQVRRRSSKACDQCRKSKCKCERSSPQEPCRNCVMLGTQCTFLGPSRKRGPPKGYIDAIEARLHQTEALVGILLGSKDSRAKGVLQDLAEDPLAKEIINRVDNSPYGYKGRSRGAEAPTSRTKAPTESDGDTSALHATHPTNEWQDQVIRRLNAAAAAHNALLPGDQVVSPTDDTDEEGGRRPSTTSQPGRPSSSRPRSDAPPPVQSPTGDARRQRRRLDEPADYRSPSAASARSPLPPPREDESIEESESGEDEIAVAVGQLSLNEDEQVRYHGKISGLHLLGANERPDGRNEGGLWRFPKARVWPPLPPAARSSARQLGEFAPRLPDLATQERLLELYFTYVHPALPIVHKATFMDDFRTYNMSEPASTDSPYSGESGYSDSASASASPHPHPRPRRRPVPPVLLLAMFSLAARYSDVDVPVPPPGDGAAMWTAGDAYMADAQVLLDRTYAASRPSTCQALLLLGHREVGIGAMAQAWLYVGMAVRMAQDLGLHRCADEWSWTGPGTGTAAGTGTGTAAGRGLFSAAELHERRRIWYACVVMDTYVCAYIGRPVAVCVRDFDTPLPAVEDAEELELWHAHARLEDEDEEDEEDAADGGAAPIASHAISCFNASAMLSLIVSELCQSIYAIRPGPAASRLAGLAQLDQQLTKWSLELPAHLRFDPAAPRSPPPPPHVLTLHMQYWCTVLLLHRPFIRHIPDSTKTMSPSTSSVKDAEIRANSRQHYDMCVQAANHITLIVSVYCEHFQAKRASVFLCYYVFTAAIMHVASLRTYPDDPQARRGLEKTMDVLKRMSVIWPSAWRALELLTGAKDALARAPADAPSSVRSSFSVNEPRHKRAAEDAGDADDVASPVYRQDLSYPDLSPTAAPPEPHPQHPQQQQGYAMALDMQSQGGAGAGAAAAAYLPPAYDRWAPAEAGFGASLSTSVLPQQYSTGLEGARGAERQRFPQFWNDYSALGQMETTYGVPVLGELPHQHQHQHQHQQQGHGHQHAAAGHSPGLYVPDEYAMYGSMPPSGPQ